MAGERNDTRTMEIKFENGEFKENVSETMQVLERLEESLKLQNAGSMFDDITDSAKKVDLSSIAENVDKLADRFSFGGEAIHKVWDNLVGYAGKVGSNILNAISKPFSTAKSAGWNRAMNIENAKFQLEGLGIAWEQVSGSISDAVDGTAFSLDAAASAAGQLAASGVNLGEDMDTALRAISGSAAMANTSYEDMSSIFIAAAGKGRLMGDELSRLSQRGLNAAAVLSKELGVTEAEVREMASKSQISFQMFADAMNKAYGDQAAKANETFSGSLANIRAALGRVGAMFTEPVIQNAPQVFNAIRVTINELKEVIKPLADIFSDIVIATSYWTAEAIKNNSTLEALKNILDGVIGVAVNIGVALAPIAQAFREAFPINLIETISNLAQKFADFATKIWLSDTALSAIYNVSSAFFQVLRVMGDVIKGIITIISPIGQIIAPIIGYIVETISHVSALYAEILKTVLTSERIQSFCQTVASAVSFMASNIATILTGVYGVWGALRDKFLILIATVISKFKEVDNIQVNFNFVEKVKDAITNLTSILSNGLGKIKDFINNFEFPAFSTICEKLAEGFGLVKTNFSGLVDFLASGANNIGSHVGGISGFLEILKTNITGVVDFLKGIINLDDIAKLGFLVLMGRLVTTVTDTTSKLGTAITSFTKIGDSLSGMFNQMSRSIKYDAAVKMATAIGIVSMSVVALSKIPVDELGKAVSALLVIFGTLFLAITLLDKFVNASNEKIKSNQIGKIGNELKDQIHNTGEAISGGIKGVGTSIAGVFESFGTTISGGIKGVGTSIAGVFESFGTTISEGTKDFLESLGKAAKALANAVLIGTTLISLAAAIGVITIAVNSMAKLTPDQATQGLTIVLTILASLTASTILLANFAKDLEGMAGHLLAYAAAITLVTNAIRAIGENLNGEQLAIGLLGLAAIMTGLVVSMQELGKIKDISKEVVPNLAAMTAAVILLGGQVQKLGEMDATAMLQGVAGMLGELVAIGVFFKAMQGVDMTGMASALIGLSVAVNLLTIPILTFGMIMTQHAEIIAGGILAIAAALGVIGGVLFIFSSSANGMAKVSLAILEANAAFALGAIGLNLMAVGIGAFVLALTTGAATIVASAAIIVKALTALVGGILDMIIQLAPKIKDTIGVLLEVAATAIASKAIVVAMASVMVVKTVAEFIAKEADSISEAVLKIITAVLTAIGNHAEELTDAALNILGGIVVGIVKKIPEMVAAIKELIGAIKDWLGSEGGQKLVEGFKAIWDAVIGGIASFGQSLVEGIKGIWDTVTQTISGWVGGAGEAAKNFIGGFINPLKDGDATSQAKEAGNAIGQASIDGLNEGIDAHSDSKKTIESGENYLGGYEHTLTDSGNVESIKEAGNAIGQASIDGLNEGNKDAKDSAEDLITKYGEGIKDGLSDIKEKGENITQNVVDGTKNKLDKASEAGKNITSEIKEGAEKKISDFKGTGNSYVEKVNVGIKDKLSTLNTSGQNITKEIKEGVDKKIDSAKESGEGFVNKVSEGISSGTSGAVSAAETLATNVVDKAGDVLGDGGETVVNTFTKSVDSTMTSNTSDIVTNFTNAGEEGGNGFINAIISTISGSGGAVGSASFSLGGIAGSNFANGAKPEIQSTFDVMKNVANFWESKKYNAQIEKAGFSGGSGGASIRAYEKQILGLDLANQKATESTDNLDSSIDKLGKTAGGSGGKGGAAEKVKETKEEVKELFDVMTDGAVVIDDLLEAYSNLWTDQYQPEEYFNMATGAVQNFADHVFRLSDEYTPEIAAMDTNSEEYLEAMKQGWDSFRDKIKESTIGQFGLFQEFSDQLSTNSVDIIKNIDDQRTAMDDYLLVIQGLEHKQIDPRILEPLVKEGLSAYPTLKNLYFSTGQEIDALNTQVDSFYNKAMSYEDTVIGSLTRAYNNWRSTVSDSDEVAQAFVNSMNTLQDASEDVTTTFKLKFDEMNRTVKQILDDQMDLFTKFEVKGEDTIETYQENIDSQLEVTKMWADDIIKVMERGIDEGVLEKLINMGPQGYDAVHAFADATEEEFKHYMDTVSQVLILKDTVSQAISGSYASAAAESAKAYYEALNAEAAKKQAEELGKQTAESLKTALEDADAKSMGVDFIEKFVDGVESQDRLVEDASENVGQKASDGLTTEIEKHNFEKDGKYICQGLADGIDDNSSIVENAVRSLVGDLQAAFEDEAEIGSPSKMTYKIGDFIAQGLANGISENSDLAGNVVSDFAKDLMARMSLMGQYIHDELGENATDGFRNQMTESIFVMSDYMQDIIDGVKSMDMTIRPTMDLTEIHNGFDDIQQMFYDTRNNLYKARGIMSDAGLYRADIGSNISNYAPININVYGTEGMSARDIANEVSVKLNHQYQRMGAAF